MEVGQLLLNRYEIDRHLAGGAMSTVWVARDHVTEEQVAIKTISLESAGWRAEVRDRFQKEAQLLALSAHDNLVGVRGSGETDEGDLFLVLDLVLGETLADRLAREPRLSWQEAARVAVGISRGVAALHGRGIVHRDLKPANIILEDRAGQIMPKVIDLGIGKVLDGDPGLTATLTATGQVLGTPQYMSYEQALGERDVDARSDVWALGAILYEMLAWQRPFHAPHVNAVLAAIRRQDRPSLGEIAPSVPAELVAIVDRCMRKERAERFQDAAALAAEIETALARSPVPQPAAIEGPAAGEAPAAVEGPAGRAPWRSRTAFKVVAAATTLAAAIALGLLTRGGPSGVPQPGEKTEISRPIATSQPEAPARAVLDPPRSGATASAAASGKPAASSAPPRTSKPGSRTTPVTRVNESGL